jgi:hypothetical protein
MRIYYLKNKQIDKTRWDEVVDASPNGLIYAYSWYLDILADHWDALIMGDYEMIMPLPWKYKYGLQLIYTPFFIQRLGVFSKHKITIDVYAAFLKAIPCKFRYINLSLFVEESIPLKNVLLKRKRTNFILQIDKPYEDIRKGYSRNVKRILNNNVNCRFRWSDDLSGIVKNYQNSLKGKVFHNMEKSFKLIAEAAQVALEKGHLIPCELVGEDEEVLASFLFFTSHERAYSIIGSQTEKGVLLNATYRLMDCFFQTYCQQIKIFDFEGSDIPGIAEFFKKWGSQPEYYSQICLTRFPINWLKTL